MTVLVTAGAAEALVVAVFNANAKADVCGAAVVEAVEVAPKVAVAAPKVGKVGAAVDGAG